MAKAALNDERVVTCEKVFLHISSKTYTAQGETPKEKGARRKREKDKKREREKGEKDKKREREKERKRERERDWSDKTRRREARLPGPRLGFKASSLCAGHTAGFRV